MYKNRNPKNFKMPCVDTIFEIITWFSFCWVSVFLLVFGSFPGNYATDPTAFREHLNAIATHEASDLYDLFLIVLKPTTDAFVCSLINIFSDGLTGEAVDTWTLEKGIGYFEEGLW